MIYSLYFEQGDGEIFIAYDEAYGEKKHRMVTCVDISTLYREKRGKALVLIQFLATLKHKHLVEILNYWVVPDHLIFIEMEPPKVISQWKSFCKRKFTPLEVLNVFSQVLVAIEYLHSQNYIHRDVHPSRIQQFDNDIVKFNVVGLPYNFKKLLKRDDFSGHINYSAPELILERPDFSNKVDIWALGCCLYFILYKKDPFDGKDPVEVKRNIVNFKLEQIPHIAGF